MGVRVLNKVARSNVADLVQRLNSNTTVMTSTRVSRSAASKAAVDGDNEVTATADEAEANVALLSSLALEDDNVERIIVAGGVEALVKSLSNASKVRSCFVAPCCIEPFRNVSETLFPHPYAAERCIHVHKGLDEHLSSSGGGATTSGLGRHPKAHRTVVVS
jgi:hypothetical protein